MTTLSEYRRHHAAHANTARRPWCGHALILHLNHMGLSR